MTYEYESNGACPFCGLRGCDHDRTKYQGPFGIAPKVSAAAPPHAACANEVARPSADETGAVLRHRKHPKGPTSQVDGIPIDGVSPSHHEDKPEPHGQCGAAVTAGETAPISVYDEPVEPPPTVVPITPKVRVERVLQGIEKRAKRKKSEQGSLF